MPESPHILGHSNAVSLRSWSKKFIPLSPSGVFKGGKGGIALVGTRHCRVLGN